MKIARAKRAKLLFFSVLNYAYLRRSLRRRRHGCLSYLPFLDTVGHVNLCMQVKECHDCVYSCIMQNTEVINFHLQ